MSEWLNKVNYSEVCQTKTDLSCYVLYLAKQTQDKGSQFERGKCGVVFLYISFSLENSGVTNVTLISVLSFDVHCA